VDGLVSRKKSNPHLPSNISLYDVLTHPYDEYSFCKADFPFIFDRITKLDAMTKQLIAVLFLSVLFFACNQETGSFQLTGHLEGLEKDEMVYLYNNTTRSYVDSIASTDGGFLFTGNVTEPTLFYVIVKRDGNSMYKGLWIEGTSISVNGNVDDIKNAKVEGSEMQRQQEQYEAKVAELNSQIDALYDAYDPNNTETKATIEAQVDSLYGLEYKEQADFIRSNPDYFYSAYLAKRLVRNISVDEAKDVYNALSEENKNTKYGQSAKEFLDINKNLQVGDTFEDLVLPDAEGNSIALSSFEGKYVLLDFWASWCGPCRRESPYLTKAYEQFKDKGFEIYAVSIDKDSDRWLEAVAEDNMIWTTVIADGAFDSKAAMMYGVKHIPYNFLIDPDGNIVKMHLRGEDLINTLEELL
jgi:peroxiredoxin